MIVEVKHVVKSIGTKEIIHNLSFQLERGRTFALLGPNGAGKTTMVRLITGLLKPSKGQIRLFDMELSPKNSDILRQKIGVQNDGNLYEDLTIGQNLDLWGQLYGIESSNIRSKIKEILDFFDLEERINSKVGQLSKGMRQKVSFARAVFHRPELLILDEPTSGLDPQSTEELTSYLNKLVENTGISIIMCTHQLQGLEEIADDIGIIQHGNLTAFGSASKIINTEFPEIIYEIGVDPKNRATEECKKYGRIYSGSQSETFRLSITEDIHISQIVKDLVESGMAVNTVFEVKHTIKDAYFNIVGGTKSD